MKKYLIVHPFLLILYPVLFLYGEYFGEVRFSETFLATGTGLGLVTLLLAIFFLITRSFSKAAIITTLFIIPFISYGFIFEKITGFSVQGILIGRHRYLIPFMLSIPIVLSIVITRSKSSFLKINQIINLSALFLILFPLFKITMMSFQQKDVRLLSVVGSATKTDRAQENLPDIYYIVLDEYGGNQTLMELYDFDNSEFLDNLERMGFFVAGNSRSHYNFTVLSLASTLNLNYIHDLMDTTHPGSIDRPQLHNLIEHSYTGDFLKSLGYKKIFFQSGWDWTTHTTPADELIMCKFIHDFNFHLMGMSMLKPWEYSIYVDSKRERLDCMFEELAAIPMRESHPKFVFAHFVAPHPPFLYDETGNPVNSNKSIWQDKEGYIPFMIYINNRITKIIETILSNSSNPVIILQSDHGPREKLFSGKLWSDPPDDALREVFPVLNSFYFPDQNYSQINDSISVVNTMRVLFNHLFETEFDLLPEQNYFAPPDQLHRLQNVTDRIRSNP